MTDDRSEVCTCAWKSSRAAHDTNCPQAVAVPSAVVTVEIRAAITGLMESLEYYAKPDVGWDEVAHANAYEHAKAILAALDRGDAR
jgi:hypothetical protein